MALLPFHRALDHLAMWTEDRRARPPVAFRAAAEAPLACFGPLPPLPAPPGPAGPWRAASPLPAPGDAEMRVHAYPARGPRRGTVVLVPPWKLPRLSLVSGFARLFTRSGLEVWTVIPPRHLARAAPGTRSGEGFVTPDLPLLRAAFEQLVLEVRVLAALARLRGGAVGVVGLSLGGLAAALAATAPEPLDFAAAVGPPVDLGAVFAGTRIGRRYLALARRAGAPVPPAETLARMLAPFRPDLRRPTARRVLVAAGGADAIALPEGARALAAAWGAELRVYPRGHLTLLFACGALRRDLRALAGAAAGDAASPAGRLGAGGG